VLKDFANDLRKVRELKGVSISEISAETRINTKFLNMLESGKFDFQPDTYIRSFLKAYARAIDEDEKRVLSDYDKAKAGFYSPRKFEKTEKPSVEANVNETSVNSSTRKLHSESVYQSSLKDDVPDYMKPQKTGTEPEYTNRSITQKILLGILILAVAAGIYFLVDYLNSSGDKKSNVKPKTFNEISNEYENRLSGNKDSLRALDSLQKLSLDSLMLVVKALKDIRVIISVDQDTKKIDEELSAKDSLVVKAASQFRFSTSNSPNTEIYLNGRFLRKPISTRGNSIKDMVITKEGIKQQKTMNNEQ